MLMGPGNKRTLTACFSVYWVKLSKGDYEEGCRRVVFSRPHFPKEDCFGDSALKSVAFSVFFDEKILKYIECFTRHASRT